MVLVAWAIALDGLGGIGLAGLGSMATYEEVVLLACVEVVLRSSGESFGWWMVLLNSRLSAAAKRKPFGDISSDEEPPSGWSNVDSGSALRLITLRRSYYSG